MSVVPSIVLAFIIVVCAAVYEKIAKMLVNLENHRDQQSYEESLTYMNYKFQFWNVYFSYFILAFWQRNITVLAQAVFTYIVFKQLGLNLVEYL